MNVFNNIRANLTKIKSLGVTFVITLACLLVAVACTVAAIDAAVGILTEPAIGLGDGFMWGFAAAYVAAIVVGSVVFGRLTQKMAATTYKELNKLHDEWEQPAPKPAATLASHERWVSPMRGEAIFAEGSIDTPEYVLLSAYFLLGAAAGRIYKQAVGRGLTDQEVAARNLLREASALLDPKTAPVRPFRRTAELTRN